MFLFLIWLLRWANLFTCRLSPFLQTFQPTLFGAHTVHTGAWLRVALPWDLCQTLKLRGDNSSSFCPTIRAHTLPCAIHIMGHQGSQGRDVCSWLPQAPANTLKCARVDGLDPEATVIPGSQWLQDARWFWVVHSSSDPGEPLEMQYLVQISLRDGCWSWSITGSGEV